MQFSIQVLPLIGSRRIIVLLVEELELKNISIAKLVKPVLDLYIEMYQSILESEKLGATSSKIQFS